MRGAAAGGLDVIALADHDTAAGFDAANAVGREVNVQVIPALEVSSTYRGRDVHVLGYFVDPGSEAILEHSARATRRREDRMREMIERLRAAGVDVSYGAVEDAAGPDRVVIGRPHLAKALVAAGYVGSVPEAFDSLIGDDAPAFVPTQLLGPKDAVEVILAGGGIPMWAHPPGDLVDDLLPELLRSGLRGLEVYRPRNAKADVLRLEGLCRSGELLVSGGSDWHSPDGRTVLGDFFVTAEEVEDLLTEGGL